MLGNIETTSQETSRESTGNGRFAFKACILLIKSVESLMNDGRFWETAVPQQDVMRRSGLSLMCVLTFPTLPPV